MVGISLPEMNSMLKAKDWIPLRLRLDADFLDTLVLFDVAGLKRLTAYQHMIELHMVNRMLSVESLEFGSRAGPLGDD